MPIPKPKDGEKQSEFMSRCHSAMADEFTDKAQRHAVCLTQWGKVKKSVQGPKKEVETQSGGGAAAVDAGFKAPVVEVKSFGLPGNSSPLQLAKEIHTRVRKFVDSYF